MRSGQRTFLNKEWASVRGEGLALTVTKPGGWRVRIDPLETYLDPVLFLLDREPLNVSNSTPLPTMRP